MGNPGNGGWTGLAVAAFLLAGPPAAEPPPAPRAGAGDPVEWSRHVEHALSGPRARLLILGTFHFADAGLDAYQPQHRLDVLSAERQREIEEIVERLAAFRPTRVAVEWPKAMQSRGDERYRRYLRGELEPDANEVVQLGFRLAGKMQHERVWLVDVDGRSYEPSIDREAIAADWGRRELLESRWWERYEELSRWSDELKTRVPLRDYLLFLNSEEALRANAGQYFVGGFNLVRGDDYPGPDHLAGWWYDRNLRIYANVQALATSADERIVLIIGQGHVPILRHAAAASPEIELIEVRDVLGDG